MKDQSDLFGATTFAPSHPIKFARIEAKRDEAFQPVVLAEAPAELVSLPENDIEQKIAKVVAVLKWVMARYQVCFSYSGGKDSSCVLSLALAAAAELRAAGTPVQPFLILNSDTLVENPEVVQVVRAELARIHAWLEQHDLPGSIEVTEPGLLDQWAVSIIGGQTLLSTPMTNRNCTTDLKSVPLTRARSRLLGKNDVARGQFVVGVTGVRYAESAERAGNMAKRAESATQIVQTNAKQDVFLAPIADWTTDDVMEYLGLAVNNLLPIAIYSDFVDVWRIYKDAEGECTVGRGDKPSKGCSARHGCFVCSMVQSDKSMDAFLANPQYAYMTPLAQFREYLNNSLFDLEQRYWVGRSIDKGYVEYAPSVYSPAYVQGLLRMALTIDRDEREAAAALGIAPRFEIVSLKALIAIDAIWSLHAYTAPFAALKAYYEVNVQGRRYGVPSIPKAKPGPMPKPRYIAVDDWDSGAPDGFSGLRNPLLEAADGPCAATRQITSNGQVRQVMAVQTSGMFSVDEESVGMLLTFELEDLVARHDACVAPGYRGAFSLAGEAYKFYLGYGTISVAKGYAGTLDQMLRRAAWRERNGLAGFNFSHAKALALSLETPVAKSGLSAEEVQAIALAEQQASRQAAQAAVYGRRISMRELVQEWAPDVSWRILMREGGLPSSRLFAHCLHPNSKAYDRGLLKGWSIHRFVRLGELVKFLKANPIVLARVQAHRSAARRKGAQLNLFAA